MNVLDVKTLGKFELREDYIVLTESEIRSPMITKLLVHLLIYRKSPTTMEELIDALWEEGEVDNPAGALKNLMYRSRILLRDKFGRSDFVITNRGSYQWNPDIEVGLDIERFEMLLEQTNTEARDRSETAAVYEEALHLYHGDFMPAIKSLYWVTPLNAYYHSLFLASVKELLAIYAENGDYEKEESVCTEALRHNVVDETIYYYLINARIRSGKLMLAMKTYEDAVAQVDRELGVRSSKLLYDAYEELMAAQGGEDVNIAAIHDVAKDLEENKPEGVFLCGYPVFKEIYRLQIRRLLKEGGECQMLLLTIGSDADDTDKIAKFRVQNAMERLEKVLISSLRMCDVATRYNDYQYIVLLPSCEASNCSMVSRRIKDNFDSDKLVHGSIQLSINYYAVMPDGDYRKLDI